MREESRRAANAFLKRKPIDLARTHTTEDSLYLHGNQIAWRESDDRGDAIVMTLAGWASSVTKERLNTVCEMLFHERPFSTKRGDHYFGSYKIRADTLIRIPMKGDQPEFTRADDIMAAALMTGEFTPGTPDWSDVVAKRIAKLQTYARAWCRPRHD